MKDLQRQAAALIPTPWGKFRMIAYATRADEPMPHLALVHETFDATRPTYLRIHSECMTGDLFHSRRCDCGEQLNAALRLAAEKGGAVIYLRQEGRNIGLINKLKAYELQDTGLNTIDANTHLGLAVDGRTYEEASAIMQDLNIRRVHLLTNNPDKIAALEASTIEVLSRIPIVIPAHRENEDYLHTKQTLMGHLLS